MRIGSLFSGAGGLDMAVESVFGGRTVWHSEVDEAASKVLGYRWPDVPNLGDITAVDWSTVEPVDVLCGGFPCQDVSAAGRRTGLKDGTRSGLWASFAGAIGALRPRVVVIENVRGLLTADGEEWPPEVSAAFAATEWRREALNSMSAVPHQWAEPAWKRSEYGRRRHSRLVRQRQRTLAGFRSLRARCVQRAIGTVLGDLADLGYDAQWTTLAASTVGAPHRRERVFILASIANSGSQFGGTSAGQRTGSGEAPGGGARGFAGRRDVFPPDTTGDGRRHQGRPESAGFVGGSNAAVSGDGPVELLPTPTAQSAKHDADDRGPGTHDDFNLWSVAARIGNGELLPTPRSSRSASTTETAYALGGSRSDEGRTQGEVLLPTPCARDFKDATASPGAATRNTPSLGAIEHYLPTPVVVDSQRGQDFARANRDGSGGDDLVTLVVKATQDTQWGKYEPAIRRWEQITRPAPAPAEPNKNGNPRLAAVFSEWMQGWPDGWVTALVALGLISRNDALRLIGNGVCPQQGYAAIVSLLSVAFEVAA